MRRVRLIALGTAVLTIVGVTAGCTTPHAESAGPTGISRPPHEQAVIDAVNPAKLDASDAAIVDAIGARIATKPGTPVHVVRASGEAAWNALSPDVDNGTQTDEFKKHEALIVSGTVNLNSAAGLGNPLDRHPVEDSEIIVLLDADSGAIVETTRIPKGGPNPFADKLTQLGPATTVTLSGYSFSDHT